MKEKNSEEAIINNKIIFLGMLEVAETAIKGGADFNRSDDLGKTPLHYAAENGNSWIDYTVENVSMIIIYD